jgi:hypothetical protein
VIEQNIPLLTSSWKRILFETGIGSLKMFGPHSGRLQTSLQDAGIDPGSVDGHRMFASPRPPTPEELQKFVQIALRYGYWLATPEENTAAGVPLF